MRWSISYVVVFVLKERCCGLPPQPPYRCSRNPAVLTAPRGLSEANEYAAERSARARPRSELQWGCACAWIRGRVLGKGLGAAKRRVAVESDVALRFKY